MKNLLIVFFLSISFQAISQIEFAPAGAEWYSSAIGVTSFIPPFTYYNRPINQKYDRDTMINGIEAKVIVNTYVTLSSDEHILTQSGDSILIWISPQFYLLYDFGAEIGETIQTQPAFDVVYDLTVLAKDTVSINGENLINYTYSMPPYDTLIVNNKFGSINNFLVYNFYVDADRGRLRCYSDSNFELIQFGDMACDSVYTKVTTGTDDLANSHDLHIYPNPVIDNINIELPVTGMRNKKIKIINFQGKVVMNIESSEGKIDLDVSKLTPAFYSIEVLTENRRFLGKFIKMDE